MNKFKQTPAHSHDQFHLIPNTDIGGRLFRVNHFMPININCEVYWVKRLSFLRESQLLRNNHTCIDNGKLNHQQRNETNTEKDLSRLVDFYVL